MGQNIYPVIDLLAGRTEGSGHARHPAPSYSKLGISYKVKEMIGAATWRFFVSLKTS